MMPTCDATNEAQFLPQMADFTIRGECVTTKSAMQSDGALARIIHKGGGLHENPWQMRHARCSAKEAHRHTVVFPNY